MKTLMLMSLILLATGCSVYRLAHIEEIDADGNVTGAVTKITKIVPPGGKDVTEGAIEIGVAPDGSWNLDLGEESQHDETGTAAMMNQMLAQFIKMAEAGATQQAEIYALRATVEQLQGGE